MYTYKFRRMKGEEIVTLIQNSIHPECILRTENGVYYMEQVGDKMAIDINNGTIAWEPARHGEMMHSILSLRLYQWFGKGYIKAA